MNGTHIISENTGKRQHRGSLVKFVLVEQATGRVTVRGNRGRFEGAAQARFNLSPTETLGAPDKPPKKTRSQTLHPCDSQSAMDPRKLEWRTDAVLVPTR